MIFFFPAENDRFVNDYFNSINKVTDTVNIYNWFELWIFLSYKKPAVHSTSHTWFKLRNKSSGPPIVPGMKLLQRNELLEIKLPEIIRINTLWLLIENCMAICWLDEKTRDFQNVCVIIDFNRHTSCHFILNYLMHYIKYVRKSDVCND